MHVADWRVDQSTSRSSRSPLRIWTAWFCPCGLRTVPWIKHSCKFTWVVVALEVVGHQFIAISVHCRVSLSGRNLSTFIWRRIRWDYRLHGPVTWSHRQRFVFSIQNSWARREFNGPFLARLAKSWSDLWQATAAAERRQARATQCCAGRLVNRTEKEFKGSIGKEFARASGGYFCDIFW